jgi:hypothetical protein
MPAKEGIDPAFIYAFKRTGTIVTESNKHRLTEKQLRQWNEAIDEYQHKVDSGKVIRWVEGAIQIGVSRCRSAR